MNMEPSNSKDYVLLATLTSNSKSFIYYAKDGNITRDLDQVCLFTKEEGDKLVVEPAFIMTWLCRPFDKAVIWNVMEVLI